MKSFKPGALQRGPESLYVSDAQTTKLFWGEDDSFLILGSFAIDEFNDDLFNFFDYIFVGEWEGRG